MSFIKRRPALAVAIALALIAVLTPVAYAVVNKVFLSIDPDQSEEQIEEDVKRQLDEAGVPTTGVTAEKDGDRLRIGIQSDDPAAELPELHVDVRGGGKTGAALGQNRVRIEAHCQLSPAQTEALTQVVSSDEFLAAVVDRHDRTDAEVAAALREVLRRHGFADTDVSVSAGGVAVTVNAPPA